MKTRDELAEMFAVVLMARPRDQQLASGIVPDAFVYADAFIAERARRAVPPTDARGECCCYSGCHDDTTIHQHADDPCPLHPDRPFAPAAEGLRFNEAGDLLGAGDDAADPDTDGHAAYRSPDGTEVAVYFKPKSREHAERIIAAVLTVGRGTL